MFVSYTGFKRNGYLTMSNVVDTLLHGLVYTGCVFSAGFGLGVLRVGAMGPLVGHRVAELVELPLMVYISYRCSKYTNKLFPKTVSSRVVVGSIALIVELLLDCAVGRARQPDASLWDIMVTNQDPVTGPCFYMALLAFAAFPALTTTAQ